MITDKPIKPGRQVYLDYERYPSYVYLLQHAFTPISNIHDCLLIPLPVDTPPSPLLSRVLLTLGYPSDDAMCLDITRFLNDRQLALFLIRNATQEHLEQCFEYYEQTVLKRDDSQWETSEIHQCAMGIWTENSKSLWESMKDELKDSLRMHLLTVKSYYHTSISHDHVLLWSRNDA